MSLIIYEIDQTTKLSLPLFACPVQAGFPSPADDFVEIELDLNEFLIKNPSSTFYAKVQGESMKGTRIYSGDILIVDRSIEPAHGDIAVCVVDGEFTAKFIEKRNNGVYLVPANDEFPAMRVSENTSFQVWGIVTHVIHNPRKFTARVFTDRLQ